MPWAMCGRNITTTSLYPTKSAFEKAISISEPEWCAPQLRTPSSQPKNGAVKLKTENLITSEWHLDLHANVLAMSHKAHN